MEGQNYQAGRNTGSHSQLKKYSQNIGSNIQKISQNVHSMKQMVNQLGTDQDTHQLRSQLHQVQHYTGALAKDTSTELRTFQAQAVPPDEDSKAWHMQAERLTKEFSQALNEFQGSQRQAALKEKEALKEAKAHTDATYFDKTSQSSPNLVNVNHSHIQLQLDKESELQGLQERESQIRQLESDIFDVNQIFKDLATMVHEQGEIIDSIEANVESAHENTGTGAEQLWRAHTYQNKSRKKKLCLFATLAVVIVILILIIYFSTS